MDVSMVVKSKNTNEFHIGMRRVLNNFNTLQVLTKSDVKSKKKLLSSGLITLFCIFSDRRLSNRIVSRSNTSNPHQFQQPTSIIYYRMTN